MQQERRDVPGVHLAGVVRHGGRQIRGPEDRDAVRDDLLVRSGEIAVLTTEEAKDAAETVKVLREFVGL